jgi:hypothetical protein
MPLAAMKPSVCHCQAGNHVRNVGGRVARTADERSEIRVRSGCRLLRLRLLERREQVAGQPGSERRLVVRLDARHLLGGHRAEGGLDPLLDATEPEALSKLATDVKGLAVRQRSLEGSLSTVLATLSVFAVAIGLGWIGQVRDVCVLG